MEKIREKLAELGLKSRDIDVYLAVLSLGKSTISSVAKRAKVKRTTVYQHIEKLLEERLIYKDVDRKRSLYCAENPGKILNILEDRKKSIERQKIKFEKIIPELQSLYSSSFNKPNVGFYEGKDGLKSIYKEILATHKNVYSIFSPKSFFRLFSFEENHELLMRLYENGGILHNLVEKSDKAIERLKKKEYNHFVKNKILPANFEFTTDLLVTDNKLALISFTNLVGVIIEDKSIAELQQKMFKYIWQSIK